MKKFNQIILVDNISPTLLLQIIDLIKAVYENIRALPNPTERETIGYDCIKFAVKMEHSYLDIGNGRINRITGLREIQSSLNKVKNYTKILADLRLWQPKTCARIAENILTIQNIIMRELKND